MQKYFVLLFIAIGWPGFDLCMAQEKGKLDSLSAPVVKLLDLRLERGLANYQRALQHPNEGVVESAMINLLKMKYHYPDLDYGKVITLIHNLESDGRNQSIRFLAYFTGRCLEDKSNLSMLQEGENEFALESGFIFKLVQR